MNFKKLITPFIIPALLILVVGISCTSKSENDVAIIDPMEEDIEYSFIHMDEYLPIKTVENLD